MAKLPDGLLLAYYGDDFTGSTDTMEAMAFAGLPTVLFVRPPTAEALRRFEGYRAIGVAGTARSRSPAWMDGNLPPIFERLFALDAPITQYKVCSTFDSSPAIGSIGHAVSLGLPLARENWSPSVVGAPQLRRWQVFGNLFAGAGDGRFRLDRHPTMARHPVTPMSEADLRRHLAAQTTLRTGLVDIVDLASGEADAALARERAQADIVLFDVSDPRNQAEVGRLVWDNRGAGLFSASSSGLQYALAAHWRASGALDKAERPSPAGGAGPILVLSGSASPVTAAQIAAARDAGFVSLRLDAVRLADADAREAAIAQVLEGADAALRSGRDVLIYTTESPDDASIEAVKARCGADGLSLEEIQEVLGRSLGRIGTALIEARDVRRVVVAGGDTSGRVVQQMPIDALEARHPLAAGSPICRVHSNDARFEGLEIVLKGGQVGGAGFFMEAKAGRTL